VASAVNDEHRPDPGSDRSELTFRVLGPIGVWRGTKPVALSRGHMLEVLVSLLLAANRIQSPQRIVAQVWGSRPLADPHGAVQTMVSRLRRALAYDLIETHPSGYRLQTSAEHLDLLRFEQLVRAADQADGEQAVDLLDQALALCSPPVLGGVRTTALADAAAALTEQYLHACEQRTEWYLRLGRHQELSRELSELVRAHPQRERLTGQLMLALYRCERRADALAVYASIEANFRRNLGVPVGPELQALHRKILRTATELDLPAAPDPTGRIRTGHAAAAATPRWRAPAPPPFAGSHPPNQLPGGTDQFTGRRRELADLESALAAHPPDNARSLIVAIDGTAGVGKTALAVQWAHRQTGRFNGGQLYADLHGYDGSSPANAARVLTSFLQALGHRPQQLPADLDALTTLFRTTTANRRLLILADNVRDSQHVRPLLPGPSCLLIATSRDQLRGLTAIEGAHRLTLTDMPTTDSLALLRRSVGARIDERPAAWATLVQLCAGLPLAITIAGEYASRLPDTPVAEFIEQLRTEHSRLDTLSTGEDIATDLRAVFAWSYRALSAHAARLFRILGLHPAHGEVSLPAAAALAGLPIATTRTGLDQLLAAHLLEYAGSGRYRWHDLLRVYARERANAEEPADNRRMASDRLVNWYLHSAAHARERLRAGTDTRLPPVACGPVAPLEFAGYSDALDWFDTEYDALTSVIRFALDSGRTQAGADLLWQLRVYHANRAHWSEWTDLSQAALGTGDPVTEARTLSGLGSAYFYQHRTAEALVSFERGRSILPADYTGPEYPMLLSQIGLAHTANGAPTEAIAVLHQALPSPWAVELPVLVNLAGAYGMAGRFQDALECGERALAQHTVRGERDAMARALCNIAEAQLNLGRLKEATDTCRQAAQLCLDIGNPDGEATALVLLGRTLHAAGDRACAMTNLDRALSILDGIGAGSSGLAEQARAVRRATQEAGLLLEAGHPH
jgi:DNA-binding SARP family transcriptional activator